MDKINIFGSWITKKEVDYVAAAVANALPNNSYVYHDKFEKAFAAYIGRKFAVSLPSCTSGLHLALLSLGVGPGDEVIVPDITWIASSAPITYVGATPIFADIDPESWCISPESIESRITVKTKAIIVVDLYGNMPDMDLIKKIADAHGIPIIEDSAEAIGSEYKGKKAGSFGAASVYSFHSSKTLTTGEGGMLVTDDKQIFDRSYFFRDHGRDLSSGKILWNSEVGYKYKMSCMQAALGLAQLERIEEIIHKKRQIFGWYKDLLQGQKGVQLNSEDRHVKNSYWLVTVIADNRYGLKKEDLIRLFDKSGVETRPFFYPLSSLPAYEALPKKQENPIAAAISPYGINLPSGLHMDEEKVNYVVKVLKDILRD